MPHSPDLAAASARYAAESPDTRRRRALAILDGFATPYELGTDLAYRNPFELLIATIISAQTTDAKVNEVGATLFARWPDAASMVRADPEEMEAVMRPLGYYRQKTRSAINCAKGLVEAHGGEVPAAMDALVDLPGVGRKTANLVMAVAFNNAEGIVVDTHVARIAQRLALTLETKPERIEKDLMEVLPRERWAELSLRGVLHGRRTCVKTKPKCEHCPVTEHCPSRQ